MAMVTAYFDASGTTDKSGGGGTPEMFVSGFVSTADKWEKFERDWPALLQELGVSAPFHMTDFEAGRGRFKDWHDRRQEKDAVLRKLATFIRQHTMKGFSQGVVRDDLRRAQTVYGDAMPDQGFETWTPYTFCGVKVIRRLFEWVARRLRRNPDEAEDTIACIFERGDRGWGQLQTEAKRVFGMEIYDREKAGICAFQPSDMLAWQHRDVLKRRRSGRPHRIRSAVTAHEVFPGSEEWGYADWALLERVCEASIARAAERAS